MVISKIKAYANCIYKLNMRLAYAFCICKTIISFWELSSYNVFKGGMEMFTVKDNKVIGGYISELIKEKNYKSDRQFGIAYLKLRYPKTNIENDDIQNMANRICQIKKGNKKIQLEDLPIFSELLGVSIVDILSAGTYVKPYSSRVSNYSIAFSKDPDEWEKYINREDKLILNPDEYNKLLEENKENAEKRFEYYENLEKDSETTE